MPDPTPRLCSVNARHELHDSRATWTTCRPCEDWIRAGLDDVERLWPLLPDHLEPARGHSATRGAAAIAPPLPLAEHVLALIAPGGVHDRLGQHDSAIRAARGLNADPVTGSVDYRLATVLRHLRDHLAWAAANVPLGDLARELSRLTGSMRAITGQTADTVSLAEPCTVQLADDATCGGTLVYDRERQTIHCVDCGTPLDLEPWRQSVGLRPHPPPGLRD